MTHDHVTAMNTATTRVGPSLLVARNLLPSVTNMNANSTSIQSFLPTTSVSTRHEHDTGNTTRPRDQKYMGEEERVATVTATSSSTMSITSSMDNLSLTTAISAVEDARRARRHAHQSQVEHESKNARQQGVLSQHNHSHNQPHRRRRVQDGRKFNAEDAHLPENGAVNADISPEKFVSKVYTTSHTKNERPVSSLKSPLASPKNKSSSSSGGQGSDKEEMAGMMDQQRHYQTATKPSRMVVKRRAIDSSKSSSRTTIRPTSVLSSPARQPVQSVDKPEIANNLRIDSSTSRVIRTSSSGATPNSLERWQIRLMRSASENSSSTDDECNERGHLSSQRLYSNYRSHQLMESPPRPDQVTASSRRWGSDLLSLDQAKTRTGSTSRAVTYAVSPGISGELLPPPPPLSLSADVQGVLTPRALARKLPNFEDGAESNDDATVKAPRPVRIRYEIPERGMGGQREISHASLGKLIARLTDAHQFDTEFRDVFLLTYRSFCSPHDFIKKLMKRYSAVLSLCSAVDAETVKETQRLLDQIMIEEEGEQRLSNVTSISTARSDINTGMEATVSIMRLLSVLKFWIKESGFIDQDLANDRKAQKKLMKLLCEIQTSSPIPSIRRHAENLFLTVAQLVSSQQQQTQVPATTQSHRSPALVISASASPLPDKIFWRPRDGSAQEPQSAVSRAMVHQLSDRGPSRSCMQSHVATKLALARSSSDPKREKSMVKLRTKNASGDIFQLRNRSVPVDNQTVAAVSVRDRMLRSGPQHQISSAAAVAPKIARGITTGSAEAATANGNAVGGFDEIIQDTLQRVRLTTASRKSARISYDNAEPLSGLIAQEMADQLTLMEADQYFSKLNLRELTNKAWTRENKHRDAPHVMALIELFDATAEWVSSEILHPQLQSAERAKMITLFIDAADNCYQMNNFNTLFEITTGLSAPCIRQLNTTWSLVTAAVQEKYQCLQQICSPDDNYRCYRQAFALAEGQPRLACWFIIVKDLFTYEEAMKSMEDGLVNWQKFRKIYRVINEALDRQNFCYVSGSSNGCGVPRKGRGILRHDRKMQSHIRHRVDTIRKDSSVLYQLAQNANTQESILFVNSLSEAGFL